MNQRKIIALISLIATITLSTFVGSALAITGNSQPDQTQYTCIVAIYGDPERAQLLGFGSGVLISPTVVVTAGHCITSGKAVSVCFDPDPSVTLLPSVSYSTDWPIYNGVGVAYPEYVASLIAGAKPSEALDTSDVGIILLDTPVTEVTPYASLPAEGLADTLKVGTSLQVIGYGFQEQIAPGMWFGTFARNAATVNMLSNNFRGSGNYIKCSANAAQGNGGIANGDSGGPVIYSGNGESVLLAINAYVNNGNCAGVTFHTRIDNPAVLSWIGGYL